MEVSSFVYAVKSCIFVYYADWKLNVVYAPLSCIVHAVNVSEEVRCFKGGSRAVRCVAEHSSGPSIGSSGHL